MMHIERLRVIRQKAAESWSIPCISSESGASCCRWAHESRAFVDELLLTSLRTDPAGDWAIVNLTAGEDQERARDGDESFTSVLRLLEPAGDVRKEPGAR